MQVLIRFHLQDCQPSTTHHRKQIEHGAVRSREGRYLVVDHVGSEIVVNLRKVAGKRRLQPRFRLQAKERVARTTLRVTARKEPLHQVCEAGFCLLLQRCFIRPGAESEVVVAGKGAGHEAMAHAGKFQAVEGKRDLVGASCGDAHAAPHARG